MTIGGQPTSAGNFIATMANTIPKTIRRNRVASDPSDGLILKLHYKWTFWLLMGFSAIVVGSWYNVNIMTCVNKFNGNNQVQEDFLSFCHSYIYVQKDDNPNERRYLFFYKWLHYVNLILAFWYYMPRKWNKAFHKPILTRLCHVLHHERSRYDENSEKNVYYRISTYMKQHMRTHNSLYFNALFCNVFALFVNITGIYMINYVLQVRFINYGWMSIPFKRDVEHFTDSMSRTFPPFAQCTIGRHHELTPGREESFGCHLVMMELYEKWFLVLWLWLMSLALMTVMYIVFLVLLFHPYVRQWALKSQKPETAKENIFHDDLFKAILYNCKIGDVWLLYKLKRNMSSHKYYMLLSELSKEDLQVILKSDPFYRAKQVDDLKDEQQPLLTKQPQARRPMQGQLNQKRMQGPMQAQQFQNMMQMMAR